MLQKTEIALFKEKTEHQKNRNDPRKLQKTCAWKAYDDQLIIRVNSSLQGNRNIL